MGNSNKRGSTDVIDKRGSTDVIDKRGSNAAVLGDYGYVRPSKVSIQDMYCRCRYCQVRHKVKNAKLHTRKMHPERYIVKTDPEYKGPYVTYHRLETPEMLKQMSYDNTMKMLIM
jgi:hypothetical protein